MKALGALAALLLVLPVPASAHPFDPLTADEIRAAVETLRGAKLFSPEALFPLVVLQEPPKVEIIAGAQSPRRAFAVIYDRDKNETSEAVVDLAGKTVESWRILTEVQPNFLVSELTSAPEIVRADPRWQEAMKKRGIADFAQVQIDGWAPGTLGVTDASGPRLARALSFFKGTSVDFYARPIEGVVALVDMNQRKVVDLIDTGVVPLSKDDGAFDEASTHPRAPLKPLTVVQTLGPEFALKGREVIWQNWHFRFALHPREGLVLYQVGYDDHGALRPILYRASLSEMVVPYGDPDHNWAWRSAFDEGEYGIGRLASPLETGIDVPENATLFDSDIADDHGNAITLPKSVALFERDGGLLWKHFTIDPNRNEARRARELVLRSMAAVGNYDYAFNWVFRQDGSLEMQVELTGIMLAKGVDFPSAAVHDHAGHAHRVSELVAAPHHQHFFNFRLDFDVDGTTNSVVEVNTRAAAPGKANPYGNAMQVTATRLATSAEARDIDPAVNRRWIVQSSTAKNALGEPTGYALLPGDNSVPCVRPGSKVRKRAGFLDHHLWVTPYDEEQMYAAGVYPNQNEHGNGLKRWAARADPIEDTDVVLWYTMGVTHLPRPEEWPIMPVTRTGFKLVPVGFFARNPALDVPKASAEPPVPPKKK